MARLREELAARDEIIVALQHVVRDLRHELENLRTEHRYAAFALDAPDSETAEHCPRSDVHTVTGAPTLAWASAQE